MKTILRAMLFTGIGCLLLAGCTKDEKPKLNWDKQYSFVSFGFYAEDNEGVLEEDYVIPAISNSMTIRLPEECDWTGLVARFTTTDNDKVMVGNVQQFSGVTANDYTETVDFTVADTLANRSAVFSVTVKKILVMKWTDVATYDAPSDTTQSKMVMSVSPVTGEPYMFFPYNSTTLKGGGSVVKWNAESSSFDQVGDKALTSVAINAPAIKFDTLGNPYVMYAAGASSSTRLPTIMKYGSGAWSVVGTEGYGEPANASYLLDFAVYGPNLNIISVYSQNSNGFTVPRRELNFAYYSGGSWTANQVVSEFNGKTTMLARLNADKGNVYLAAAVQTTGYFMFKYSNNAWTQLGGTELFDGTETGPNIYDLQIVTDRNGVPYVLAGDYASDGIRLAKYIASSNTWSVVGGGKIEFTMSSASYSVGFDANNTPVVVYRTASNTAPINPIYAITIDNDTQQWTDPVVLATETESDRISFSFDSYGAGYLAYVVKDVVPNSTTSYYKYVIKKYALDTDE